jgi:tripartite-type tricarboxylate transporter receptor subunit TctC
MRLAFAAALTLALTLAGSAFGAVYPARPITIIVPFAAGGPADTLARMLGQHMQHTLGQPLIVENAAGAAGTIGVTRVVRATPDGYTIGIGHLGTHVFNGALCDQIYDGAMPNRFAALPRIAPWRCS